jgi:P27 family predicted phage terminase small subunit
MNFKAPKDLGERGLGLWNAVMKLNKGLKISQHEYLMLETLCHLADRIAECRASLKVQGLVSKGRYGQPISNPLLETEARSMAEFRHIVKLLGLSPEVARGGV